MTFRHHKFSIAASSCLKTFFPQFFAVARVAVNQVINQVGRTERIAQLTVVASIQREQLMVRLQALFSCLQSLRQGINHIFAIRDTRGGFVDVYYKHSMSTL